MTKINPIMSGMLSISFGPDEEHKRIIRKLMAYGYRSTGSKSGDKELLRKIELKQVQMENCVNSKYITVSKREQEKIIEKKKEKRLENNPEQAQNTMKGQKILGEQLMIAIEMNKKKEEKLNIKNKKS